MTTKWMEMTDHSKLFVRDYPVEDATTTVVVLHGLAEHSARYEQFAGELNDKGYHVLVPDHRGHGQTGERAIVTSPVLDTQISSFREISEADLPSSEINGRTPAHVDSTSSLFKWMEGKS